MNIALTNVNYASKTKRVRPKREGLVFCLLSVLLLLCLLISPAAAAVEWEISPSSPIVGDTLKIKGTASPCERLTAEVSFEKEVPVSEGRYEYSLENIKVPEGKDNRFTVEAEEVQNLNVNVQKWIWIKLHSDASSEGVATISQGNVPPFTYNILIDGDAGDVRCETSSANLIFTASQTLETNSKGKFKYSYDTSSIPAGEFTIKIGDVEQTIELKAREKPVAEFSAVPTSGKAPLKVSFTDLSTGKPTSWKWRFGDGTYSTRQNPVYTYDKEGTYTVSLKVKNADGSDETTKCSYITVLAPLNTPVAKFSASSTSGKAPLKVSFTDQSTGEPTSWKWRFGDGTYSTNQNPVHTYNTAGKYTVSLEVKNDGGTDTEIRSKYIIVSKRKYSTNQNPVHTYNTAGKCTVGVKVKNYCGKDTETRSK